MDDLSLILWQVLNIIFAVGPAILLCIYIYKMDIIEKEPIPMLLILFFLGVVITVPVAYVESKLISIVGINYSNTLSCFILAFCIVALAEEGFKYLILYFGTWKNKNFDHIYDGIVYAVFISLGFAMLENLLYVAQPTFSSIRYMSMPTIDAIKSGTDTAMLRALISVPAHGFYAVTSGYYFGLAKLNNSIGYKKKTIIFLILSLFVPVVLHGLFDFLLLISDNMVSWTFYCFVSILYIASYFNVRKISAVEMTSSIQKTNGGSEDERNIQE